MKRRNFLALAAAGSQALFAAEGDIPLHPTDLKFPALDFEPPNPADYRHELPGGAVGYLVEDHQLPLVSVSLIVRTGAYLVAPEHTGLASMTGSQMRSGGTKSMSARDFDEESAFLATRISCGIGATSGRAAMSCLKQNLDVSLNMFFDMLRHPGFDPERLEISRARRLQGMQRRNDEISSIAGREYSRLMRGDHFSARSSTQATIESITPDLMRELQQKYFHPASFYFAVSGDFDTKEMIDRLGEYLTAQGWPAEKPEVPAVPAPTHKPTPGVYFVNKSGVNQSSVQIGQLGIARKNPDHIAVGIMNDILGGGGFVSRIMSRVRSDEGLAYSAGSSFSPGLYYPGTFTASFQSKNPTCAEASTIVLEEIAKMRETRPTDEELATSRNYAVEVFPRYFAVAGQVAGTFAADEYSGREKGYWEKYRDRVSAVSADDVQSVAQKYLKPEELAILAVGAEAEMLAGNPDKPQYGFRKLAEDGKINVIPLPDPMTMVYPEL